MGREGNEAASSCLERRGLAILWPAVNRFLVQTVGLLCVGSLAVVHSACKPSPNTGWLFGSPERIIGRLDLWRGAMPKSISAMVLAGGKSSPLGVDRREDIECEISGLAARPQIGAKGPAK